MTKLHYRGHAYEQRSTMALELIQLRYDRSHFNANPSKLPSTQDLTYRGCRYTTEGRQPIVMTSNIMFCYRGVTYSH